MLYDQQYKKQLLFVKYYDLLKNKTKNLKHKGWVCYNRTEVMVMPYRIERNRTSPYKNMVVEMRNFKGDFPSHTHEFFEWSYIFDGEAVHTINGQEHFVKKGDLCILFPTDFHEVKSETGMCSMYFSFTEEVMSSAILYDLIESKKESVYHLTEKETAAFRGLFQSVVGNCKGKQKGKDCKKYT